MGEQASLEFDLDFGSSSSSLFHDYLRQYLNCAPDRDLNSGPFDLELSALTIIPPCFGKVVFIAM